MTVKIYISSKPKYWSHQRPISSATVTDIFPPPPPGSTGHLTGKPFRQIFPFFFFLAFSSSSREREQDATLEDPPRTPGANLSNFSRRRKLSSFVYFIFFNFPWQSVCRPVEKNSTCKQFDGRNIGKFLFTNTVGRAVLALSIPHKKLIMIRSLIGVWSNKKKKTGVMTRGDHGNHSDTWGT